MENNILFNQSDSPLWKGQADYKVFQVIQIKGINTFSVGNCPFNFISLILYYCYKLLLYHRWFREEKYNHNP